MNRFLHNNTRFDLEARKNKQKKKKTVKVIYILLKLHIATTVKINIATISDPDRMRINSFSNKYTKLCNCTLTINS